MSVGIFQHCLSLPHAAEATQRRPTLCGQCFLVYQTAFALNFRIDRSMALSLMAAIRIGISLHCNANFAISPGLSSRKASPQPMLIGPLSVFIELTTNSPFRTSMASEWPR